MSILLRIYSLLLLTFPARHRAEFSAEMLDAFHSEVTARRQSRGVWHALRFVVAASVNAVGAGLGERHRSRQRHGGGRGVAPSAIGRDVVYAIRSLARARTFTLVCGASLGIGMGVVIALVIILRGVTGPPPGITADGLVELVITPVGALRNQTGGRPIEAWSFPDFRDVRDANTGLTITGWAVDRLVLTLPGETGVASAATMYVSANYFSNVGVGLSHGRGFGELPQQEASPPPEAIVSHEFWQNRLGGDPAVVGRTMIINRADHAIVGIAQRGFQSHLGPEGGGDADVWVPLGRHPRLSGARSVEFRRDADWVRVLGRLSSGVSLEQANHAVSSVMGGIAAQFPDTNEFKQASVELYFAMGTLNRLDATLMRAALVSMASVVLLVVCVNISGMVLVRSAARERELAVRLALGASRSRLIQSLLAESMVLALVGGGLAAAMLFGGPRVLMWWYDMPHSADLDLLLRVDRAIVASCVGICVLTSLVFGLVPAIRFSRPTLVAAIKDEVGTTGRRTGRVHRWTTALQAGLAVPFLVLSVVMLGEFRASAVADLGFKPTGIFAASLDLDDAGYSASSAPAYLRTVRQTLSQAPGVTAVSVADGVPLDGDHRIIRVSRVGDARFVQAHTTRIGEHYMDTVGIRLLRGRSLTDSDDAGTELSTVISKSLAARLFGDSDPLGEKLTFAQGNQIHQVTVVGVTADVVSAQIDAARPQLFLSLAQLPATRVVLIARSASDERSMQAAFVQALAGLDPASVRASVVSAEDFVRSSLGGLWSQSMMAGLLGAVALVLTALGVFGVIGFMVATRTREIGVRMALGASRATVRDMVLRDTMRLVAPGVAVGVVLAALLLWSQNFGWMPQPLAYVVAVLMTVGVALLSGLYPARRAAAVEPLIAMRSE